MSRLAKTFTTHKEGVLAAAVCPEFNGTLEGINSNVKLLKRWAYGYRNKAHFMHRIRLETGPDSVKDNLWRRVFNKDVSHEMLIKGAKCT